MFWILGFLVFAFLFTVYHRWPGGYFSNYLILYYLNSSHQFYPCGRRYSRFADSQIAVPAEYEILIFVLIILQIGSAFS